VNESEFNKRKRQLLKNSSYSSYEDICQMASSSIAKGKLSDYSFVGKVLGEGAYAVVRQAKHMPSGQ
jgi:hypothetical protein